MKLKKILLIAAIACCTSRTYSEAKPEGLQLKTSLPNLNERAFQVTELTNVSELCKDGEVKKVIKDRKLYFPKLPVKSTNNRWEDNYIKLSEISSQKKSKVVNKGAFAFIPTLKRNSIKNRWEDSFLARQ